MIYELSSLFCRVLIMAWDPPWTRPGTAHPHAIRISKAMAYLVRDECILQLVGQIALRDDCSQLGEQPTF